MTRAALYARLPLTESDRWWLELAREAHAPRVLELGAGSGRLAVALAAVAAEVVAVERDPDMVALLRRSAGSDVTVVEGDVTALPDLGRFGLVLLPASLLNELPDAAAREAVLRGAAQACQPDGVVGLQLIGPWWLAALPARSVGRLEPADGSASIEVVVEDRGLEACSGRRRATVRYRFADGSTFVDQLDAAIVTPVDLESLMASVGLVVTEVWGARPRVSPPRGDEPAWHVLAIPGRSGSVGGGSLPVPICDDHDQVRPLWEDRAQQDG